MDKTSLSLEIKKLEKELKRLEKKYKIEEPKPEPVPIIVKTTYATFQLTDECRGITKKKAREIVEDLNKNKHLGFDDWRLPTIAEVFLIAESDSVFLSKVYYHTDTSCVIAFYYTPPYIGLSSKVPDNNKNAIFIREVKKSDGQTSN